MGVLSLLSGYNKNHSTSNSCSLVEETSLIGEEVRFDDFRSI
jgi:hypothetical protein